MAIASVGTLGTGAASTSANNFAFNTVTNALASGDFAILVVATDNIQTTTAANPTTNHTGVAFTDTVSRGHWTKLGEYTNSRGSAGAGATNSVWLFEATAAVTIGTGITITLSANTVDKTCSFWKYTKGAGMRIRLCTGTGFTDNPIVSAIVAANGFGSSAFSGAASAPRLYFRGLSKEVNSTAFTASTNFTAITVQRSRNNASAMCVRGEFRINTSTGETSNPTLATAGNSAGQFFALEEYDPRPVITVQPTNQKVLESVGVGGFSLTATGAISYQWQELISSGGGGNTAVKVGSVVPVALPNSNISGFINLTVPSGANAFIIGGTFYRNAASTVTKIEGNFITTDLTVANGNLKSWNNTPQMGGYVGHGKVSATGARNIQLTHSSGYDEGPTCLIQFLTVSDVDDWVREFDYANATTSPAALSVALDTVAGDLVFRYAGSDGGGYAYGQAGFTQQGSTQTTNFDNQTLWEQDTSVDGPTNLTTVSAGYPTLSGVSVKNAGGGSSWTDMVGETANSLSLTGLTIADDNGRQFRNNVSNADGTTTSNVVTLTVTDGKLVLIGHSTAPAEAPSAVNTKNITAPSGILSGHRELILVAVGALEPSVAPVINAITGWTTKPEWQSGDFTMGAGVFALRLAIFEREATGPGATAVATSNINGYWGWDRLAFDNANVDFIANQIFTQIASTTAPVAPGLTPSKNNGYLIDWHVLGMLSAITEALGMTELSENTDHALGLYGRQLDDLTPVPARTYTYAPTADSGVITLELHSLVSEVVGGPSNLKLRVGSDWVPGILKQRIGGAWVAGTLKARVGSDWK